MRARSHRNRAAFTFIELMVVIAIFTVILALLMSAIQRVREAANKMLCTENLHQVAIAIHHHNLDKQTPRIGALSWMVYLLPYIEEDDLFQRSIAAQRVQPRTDFDPPHVGNHTVINLYRCPTDSRLSEAHVDPDGFRLAFSSYMGIEGGSASFDGDGFFGGAVNMRLINVHDGLSNTLMVGERPPPDNWLAGRWYSGVTSTTWTYFAYRGPDQVMHAGYPGRGSLGPDCFGPFHYGPGRTQNPCDRWHFWSLHTGGANFAFCDGSVRFLPYAAEPMLVALATCNGGEVVDLTPFE